MTSRTPTSPQRRLQLVSASDLLCERGDRSSYLVDRLIPATGVTLLGGPPKSYKTLLTLQIAVSVASGRPAVIGRVISRGGPVLFIEEEGGRTNFRNRLDAVLAAAEVAPSDADLYFALHQGVRLDDVAWVEHLDRQLAQMTPALVVLDPLAFLHDGEENSNSDMARVMKHLVRLAQQHSTSVLVIHHLSKPGERSSGRATDRLRGASALGGATDANLILEKRKDNAARLQGEFRDDDDIQMGLEFDPDRLTLGATEAVPGRASRQLTPHAAAALLDDLDGRTLLAPLVARSEFSRNTVQEALQEAAELGLIGHDRDRRGRHVYWRINDLLAA